MKKLLFPFAVACLVWVSGCQAQTEKKEQAATQAVQSSNKVQDISPAELNDLLKTKPNLLLVDVRTPEEVAAAQLEGAQHIDFYDNQFKEKMLTLDKNEPVYVYCAVGGRSGKAAKMLVKEGYQVYNLKGGIRAWQAENLPVIKK